jgi:ectoine hydroxylase-related dioxygenase (phytanoyl-CoA dioxygenase family)
LATVATTKASPIDDIKERGYAVIEGAATPAQVQAVMDGLAPYLDHGPHGRNDFEGFNTQRVYNLPAKTRAFDPLIQDERVLAIAQHLLGDGFLLTAGLAINLGPGETAQSLHYDEVFYRLARPRRPLALSTLWAIDDFTAENGGTMLIPGSHRWGDDRQPTENDEVVTLEMAAGSVFVYPGLLWHAGGANTTNGFRLGISIQYCVAWGRQQESYVLGVPPEIVKQVSPRMRELLGFSIHPPFMGMIDGRHPLKAIGMEPD